MNYDFEKESKRPLLKKIIFDFILLIAEIAAVVFLAYLIVNYALEKTEMIGISMEGTLKDHDKVIINKFTYRFTDPKRFEVIVFQESGNEHSYYDIKRIIGLPGERIQIIDGQIYINGAVVEDVVNVDQMNNYGLATEEILLEENEYFVLGDNRNNSEDSRFASVGTILKEEIIGQAFIRLSPFNFVNKLNLKKEVSEETETTDDVNATSEETNSTTDGN
ncbi:MAG: signal peptidase I [Mobilitalea sp.]